MFSWEGILNLVVILGVILFSMVLHELAHGVVAYWLGDDTAKDDGRLTLNPAKHIDLVMSILVPVLLYMSGGPIFGGAKPVPVDTRNLKFGAWGMALVAIAGPLTNFLIALVSFLIGYWTGWLNMPGIVGLIFTELVLVNLGFGIFNLIPIPPLDGSRVLYALAPDVVREGMEKFEKIGLIVVMILVIVFPSVISTIMLGGIQGMLTGFYWLVGVPV
ncbi:MAG: site-2 protease family protein [Lachnospiraceae bacterium]|nr:site-2 protease family protein [Lachnospiraceae bacterium]